MAKNFNKFNSVRSESLSSRIVSQVLEAIFAKELKAGEFLGTEAQLSQMFQTSRLPVREALSQLEALGILHVKTGPNGGATIAQGEPDQFAVALSAQFVLIEATPTEIFDARIAIESRAAEIVAKAITKTEMALLWEQLAVVKEPNLADRDATEAILSFHHKLVDASKSRTLIALMHGLEQPLFALYLRIPLPLSGRTTGYSGLAGILEAIEAGDEKLARERMHDHLLFQRDRIVEQLEGKVGS